MTPSCKWPIVMWILIASRLLSFGFAETKLQHFYLHISLFANVCLRFKLNRTFYKNNDFYAWQYAFLRVISVMIWSDLVQECQDRVAGCGDQAGTSKTIFRLKTCPTKTFWMANTTFKDTRAKKADNLNEVWSRKKTEKRALTQLACHLLWSFLLHHLTHEDTCNPKKQYIRHN